MRRQRGIAAGLVLISSAQGKVESLLAADEGADQYLETSAFEIRTCFLPRLDLGRDPSLAELHPEGLVPGTPSYLSPEQLGGYRLDVRSDVFSLGAVLYEMAAGRRAFDGRSDAAILDSVLNRAPAPVLQLNPSMPPGLGDVIAKALEKDPEARYQNGADLRAELKRLEREIDSLRMTRTLPMHGGDSPVKEPNQPARLGRYQLIGRLGAVAMGTVYEGIDPIIGRSVAIKTILQNRLGSHTEAEQLRERLLREARAAGSLTHPNIVTVFDAGEKAGVTYIVMALICGSTLDAALTGKPYTGAHVIWTGGCRSNPRPPPGNCQNPGVKPFAFSGSGNRSVLFWTAVKNDCDRETQRREA